MPTTQSEDARPGTDTAHPEVSSRVVLVRLGEDGGLTGRVRQVERGTVLVSRPLDETGEAVWLRSGDLVELSWQAADGRRSARAELRDVDADGSCRLVVVGPVGLSQRRDAVRAPAGVPVTIRFASGVATYSGDSVHAVVELQGATLDLSEGGARCALRPHPALDPATGDAGAAPGVGTTVELRLELDTGLLVTAARLVRVHRSTDQRHVWSLAFVDLPERAADRIRAHVFSLLRTARARGLV
ncbi:flagellar brake protein [Goekera deserti]|uniref:PilZ domain-containing protein n=1 Tax=Goekera deserti TaxID=2497753 RepID=A0A7K3W978_9ACTN|nr:PilZ domain-containing protein [Goekera deserti]NDI49283.1 hypothetical protein [Goekera deserti]NEL53021.1 PilZ domain-containing protein [Goekera deserti]